MSLDSQYYYDSGFEIGVLRVSNAPYLLVLEDKLDSRHLKPQRFNFSRFGRLVYDFFKYFVPPAFFNPKEVSDIVIPSDKSSQYTFNGDIYVRRFGPFHLLESLDNLGLEEVSPTGKLENILTLGSCNGFIPESMAASLAEEIPAYNRIKETKKKLKDLSHSTS